MGKDIIRSSTAEYLTYVASTGDNEESIEMRYEDENIWLTQKMLATLYGVSVPAINQHIKRIYSDKELEPNSTIKKYLIVQTEGSRGSPVGKIHKSEVTIAKNYLSEKELKQLSRIVSAYLDMAEAQAERHIPMTMADWEERLNGFLRLWDREVLQDSGKISKELAKLHAETEFEKYRIIQDRLYQSDFDRFLLEGGDMDE